jgi:hypothetical protein
MKKIELAIGRNHKEPIWLGDPASYLRQKLGSGDPDRDRQSDSLSYRAAQSHGDLGGSPGDAPQTPDVEKRFVD